MKAERTLSFRQKWAKAEIIQDGASELVSRDYLCHVRYAGKEAIGVLHILEMGRFDGGIILKVPDYGSFDTLTQMGLKAGNDPDKCTFCGYLSEGGIFSALISFYNPNPNENQADLVRDSLSSAERFVNKLRARTSIEVVPVDGKSAFL